MNGAHDMGGMHGFGRVEPEADEPWFHAEWERRAFALTLAMGGTGEWNLDMSRFARENRAPDDYLSKSYYQLWVAGLEQLLAERGLVAAQELQTGNGATPARPVKRVLAGADVDASLARGAPTERAAEAAARFTPGDRVRTKTINPVTHTRLPRYARNHVGVIERVHGCHVYPDTNARGAGENPQWLYTVAFTGRELWGDAADPDLTVSVDAWEPYLEPAALA